jgi:ubiquitin-protein ligase
MSIIDERMQVITVPRIARRIIRELQDMKKIGIICDDNSINITNYHEKDFNITFKNIKDNRVYKFTITQNYPFSPPKLELNYKSYSSYLTLQSENFREIFCKLKGQRCLCCETLTCPDNWSPQFTLNEIIDEVDKFHKECREIADIVIVNVIKRKYLIDDVNILEWLY